MDKSISMRMKLIRSLFAGLLDKHQDEPIKILEINICLQGLDDIISALRSTVVSKNSYFDFKDAVDFFLIYDKENDPTYQFSFINICKDLNIDYEKIVARLKELLPEINKIVDKKVKNIK